MLLFVSEYNNMFLSANIQNKFVLYTCCQSPITPKKMEICKVIEPI